MDVEGSRAYHLFVGELDQVSAIRSRAPWPVAGGLTSLRALRQLWAAGCSDTQDAHDPAGLKPQQIARQTIPAHSLTNPLALREAGSR